MKIGKKLGVTGPHRKAMLRSMTLALLERDRIQTTASRAKELRWSAEHVVTLAKRGDLASRRRIVQLLGATETRRNVPNRARAAIERLYKEIAPRFKDRTGGYTQILRLATRRAGDNAEMCLMQYLPVEESKKGKSGGKDKKEAKPAKKEVKAAAADKNPKEKKAEPSDRPAKKDKAKDQEKA